MIGTKIDSARRAGLRFNIRYGPIWLKTLVFNDFPYIFFLVYTYIYIYIYLFGVLQILSVNGQIVVVKAKAARKPHYAHAIDCDRRGHRSLAHRVDQRVACGLPRINHGFLTCQPHLQHRRGQQ